MHFIDHFTGSVEIRCGRLSPNLLCESDFQPHWFAMKPSVHNAINKIFRVSIKPFNRFCLRLVWKTLTTLHFLTPILFKYNLQRTPLVTLCITTRSTILPVLLYSNTDVRNSTTFGLDINQSITVQCQNINGVVLFTSRSSVICWFASTHAFKPILLSFVCS
jgi:hypothetical protein